MNESEIRAAMARDGWDGCEDIIAAARRIQGEDWAGLFRACEGCGALVADVALSGPLSSESLAHPVQAGRTMLDREGMPCGLPEVDYYCEACAEKNAEEGARLAAEDAEESWRRHKQTE